MIVKDTHDIGDDKVFRHRHSCSEKHPGICATRDCAIYLQCLALAKNLEAALDDKYKGRFVGFTNPSEQALVIHSHQYSHACAMPFVHPSVLCITFALFVNACMCERGWAVVIEGQRQCQQSHQISSEFDNHITNSVVFPMFDFGRLSTRFSTTLPASGPAGSTLR
jgi:hypothetical protein